MDGEPLALDLAIYCERLACAGRATFAGIISWICLELNVGKTLRIMHLTPLNYSRCCGAFLFFYSFYRFYD